MAASPSGTPSLLRDDSTDDSLPLLAWVCDTASANVSDSFLPRRRISDATRKVTAAEMITESTTPTTLAPGVCSKTAMMLPGAAGARSPEPAITLVSTPLAPPAIIATRRSGRLSTYGK